MMNDKTTQITFWATGFRLAGFRLTGFRLIGFPPLALRPPIVLGLLTLLTIGAGCSTYDTRHHYRPKIASTEFLPDDAGIHARVHSTIYGFRRTHEILGPGLEIRVRLHNLADEELIWWIDYAHIITGDLQEISMATTDVPPKGTLAAGDSVQLRFYFPLNRREVDIDAVNFEGGITFNESLVKFSHPFERSVNEGIIWSPFYDPYRHHFYYSFSHSPWHCY